MSSPIQKKTFPLSPYVSSSDEEEAFDWEKEVAKELKKEQQEFKALLLKRPYSFENKKITWDEKKGS